MAFILSISSSMAFTFQDTSMINKEVLHFFVDELEKEGATSVDRPRQGKHSFHKVFRGVRSFLEERAAANASKQRKNKRAAN